MGKWSAEQLGLVDVALASDSSARQRILELSDGGCEVAVDCSGEFCSLADVRVEPGILRSHLWYPVTECFRSITGSRPSTPHSRSCNLARVPETRDNGGKLSAVCHIAATSQLAPMPRVNHFAHPAAGTTVLCGMHCSPESTVSQRQLELW